MLVLILIKALLYTAVISIFATVLDFSLSHKIGAIDVPADTRRMHRVPTPRIGGISIFGAFVIASFIMQGSIAPQLIFILSGAVLITATGIVDDSRGLSPYIKLFCQGLSTIIFILGTNTLYEIPLYMNFLFFVWCLTLTNAHNFIDGLDGLCAGISIIESLYLGIAFFLAGLGSIGIISFMICGASIGFFPYNYKNAKIFMGDTGSTFLGFSLSSLSVILFLSARTSNTVCSIILIFLVPLSDIIFAVTRRTMNGKNPFYPDRSHVHHILCDLGLGHRGASLTLRALSLISAAIGIAVFTS